jgi:CHAD domain-containing protein
MAAGRAAAAILRAQIANVREHAPAAVVGEVEGIHDLRVSVKRLRESMRLFRRLLPTRRREAMMPVVELLNDTLGQVRERDVLILDAQELASAVGDDGGLTAAAIAQWQSERQAAFEHLLRVWSRMCSEGLFDALDETRRRTAKRGRSANRASVGRFAYRAATRALERVHERLGPALAGDDPAPLHRLRIGVKRLRYSLEPFVELLPALKEPTRLATDAQELLGLTHDHDVLRAALAAHLEELAPEQRPAAEAALALLAERREERAGQARAAIERLADPAFDRSVLDALD